MKVEVFHNFQPLTTLVGRSTLGRLFNILGSTIDSYLELDELLVFITKEDLLTREELNIKIGDIRINSNTQKELSYKRIEYRVELNIELVSFTNTLKKLLVKLTLKRIIQQQKIKLALFHRIVKIKTKRFSWKTRKTKARDISFPYINKFLKLVKFLTSEH